MTRLSHLHGRRAPATPPAGPCALALVALLIACTGTPPVSAGDRTPARKRGETLSTTRTQAAPGTSATRIRIGGLLPLSGPLAPQGKAIAGLLSRYFDRINAMGGVNGRKIEYVTRDAGATGAAARKAASELLQEPRSVFCFLANAGPGADPELLAFLSQRGVPLVGPLVFAPGNPGRGPVFYFLASLDDQGRAAARLLARTPGGGVEPIALVRGPSADDREMADGFAAEAREHDLALATEDWGEKYASDVVRRLRKRGAPLLAFFGGLSDAQRMLEEARRQNWTPRLLVSAVLLGGRLEPWPGGLLLISPPRRPDHLHPGATEFKSLVRAGVGSKSVSAADPRHSSRTRSLQMAAFAAAKVLTESLERSGRDVSRAKLLDALRNVREFTTGVMPPVSFGPNRRLGVRGALLVSMDAGGRVTRGEWLELGAPGS